MSSMWPFRRREPDLPPPPDWRPGDVAECVRDDWRGLTTFKAPRIGAQAIVIAVRPGRARGDHEPGWALQLAGYPALWKASAFRKAVPSSLAINRCAVEQLDA